MLGPWLCAFSTPALFISLLLQTQKERFQGQDTNRTWSPSGPAPPSRSSRPWSTRPPGSLSGLALSGAAPNFPAWPWAAFSCWPRWVMAPESRCRILRRKWDPGPSLAQPPWVLGVTSHWGFQGAEETRLQLESISNQALWVHCLRRSSGETP